MNCYTFTALNTKYVEAVSTKELLGKYIFTAKLNNDRGRVYERAVYFM